MKIVHSRIRTSLLAPMVALPLIASVAFGCRSESEQIMGKRVVDAYAETTLCIGSNTNGSKWVGNKTDVATKLMEFGLIIVEGGLPVAHNEGATVNIRNTRDYGRIEVLDTVIEGSDTDRYKVTYRMLGQEKTVDTVKCPEIGGKNTDTGTTPDQ